ncbi:MAG: hypothetical protein JSS90_04215 [Bacteroidetes bacterium]|nr:hypothetical protein [Bacteroidota bacterium]
MHRTKLIFDKETERQNTRKFLLNPIYSLLLVFMLFTSCNGQVRTNSPQESGHPKMSSAMLQDKSGDIWFISHKDGVYRYDGKTFTNFSE